jgi:hypothetical protein
LHVAITEIVCEDDDDIRLGREESRAKGEEENQVFHGGF